MRRHQTRSTDNAILGFVPQIGICYRRSVNDLVICYSLGFFIGGGGASLNFEGATNLNDHRMCAWKARVGTWWKLNLSMRKIVSRKGVCFEMSSAITAKRNIGAHRQFVACIQIFFVV